MAITLDGTTGITTPGLTNTGTETIVNLTTTGNTILGNASTDTLNVGNGDLIKDASGNLGIGRSPTQALDVYRASGAMVANIQSGSSHQVNFKASNTHDYVALGLDGTNVFLDAGTASPLQFYTANLVRMTLSTDGNLTITGATATKASGTTWANPSDIRLKDNVTDYSKGLAELMQVNVKEWTYNGKGGTTEGMKGLGVIADEIMEVLPNTVDTYQAKLNADDEDDTDIKKFDATEITWLMLNAIQEQQALITSLTARLEVLEAK